MAWDVPPLAVQERIAQQLASQGDPTDAFLEDPPLAALEDAQLGDAQLVERRERHVVVPAEVLGRVLDLFDIDTGVVKRWKEHQQEP